MRLAFVFSLMCLYSRRLRPVGGERFGGVLLSIPLMMLFHTSVRAWSQLHAHTGLLYGPCLGSYQLRASSNQNDTPPRQPEETKLKPPLPCTGSNAHCATLLGMRHADMETRTMPFPEDSAYASYTHAVPILCGSSSSYTSTVPLARPTPYSWFALLP